MNDVVKNVQKELVEVNLSEEGREKMVKISKGQSGKYSYHGCSITW